MSQVITLSELEGLNETQLREKRRAILSDLAARGLTLEECPQIAVSLRFIDEALARIARRVPTPPRPPRL
jgi:hypothetical protein